MGKGGNISSCCLFRADSSISLRAVGGAPVVKEGKRWGNAAGTRRSARVSDLVGNVDRRSAKSLARSQGGDLRMSAFPKRECGGAMPEAFCLVQRAFEKRSAIVGRKRTFQTGRGILPKWEYGSSRGGMGSKRHVRRSRSPSLFRLVNHPGLRVFSLCRLEPSAGNGDGGRTLCLR